MNLPDIGDAGELAWFLDFDGTLVEIAARPEHVVVEDAARLALARLQAMTGGAVAIVTGREIHAIDAFLAPLVLPVAGVHGLTRRNASGVVRQPETDMRFLAEARTALAPLMAELDGLLIETKSTSLALHYRARPDAEARCLAAMEALASRSPETHLLRGKMVIELRAGGADKGTAVAEFLDEAPFRGRRPFFAGDDVTDEDAFRLVNARGGISIKIGPGETAAVARCPDTATFLAWLTATLGRSTGGGWE